MPENLASLFVQHGLPILEHAIRQTVGHPVNWLSDDAQFQGWVGSVWKQLPTPLRLLQRGPLKWDEMCQRIRREVFLNRGGATDVRPDLGPYLAQLTQGLLGKPAPRLAPPQPPAPPLDSPRSPPSAGGSSTRLRAVQPSSAGGSSTRLAAVSGDSSNVVVGIDLGTTYSVIAYLDGHGRPATILNSLGDMLTPSAIFFDDGGVIVGKEALKAGVMDPGRLAVCPKRDMGSPFFRRPVKGDQIPPQVLSSFILRSLKADAERKIGAFTKAVITVPAYFDEPRRQATVEAGRLAGLEVLDILNEPTAAAIAYGYQLGFLNMGDEPGSGQTQRVLVYDLGGGTFDVTIVEIRGTSFRAVATDGDMGLGGKDWDEKLVEMAAQRFQADHGVNPRATPETEEELWISAEEAKKSLTERPKATMYVNHQGRRARVEVTREEFETVTSSLLRRTRNTVELVVRQAGLDWSQIDRILLVGGSTRMPAVSRMLEELVGQVPDRSISVDEAVAHGAALFADLIMRRQSNQVGKAPFSVTNVNSHSLGLAGIDRRTGRPRNVILIPKNTPLPRDVIKTFPTARAGQPSVKVVVVEGESERPELCTQVGNCVIRGLPPDLPAGTGVQVRYAYEENGRLVVSAEIKGYNAKVATTFVRDNSLPEESLQLWNHYVEQESQRF